MRLIWPQKDPSDFADYQIDWSLLLAGDTIVGSTWVAPVGFTLSSLSFTATTTTVWLSGGAVGVQQIANTITTAGGRTFERSVDLTVAQL